MILKINIAKKRTIKDSILYLLLLLLLLLQQQHNTTTAYALRTIGERTRERNTERVVLDYDDGPTSYTTTYYYYAYYELCVVL